MHGFRRAALLLGTVMTVGASALPAFAQGVRDRGGPVPVGGFTGGGGAPAFGGGHGGSAGGGRGGGYAGDGHGGYTRGYSGGHGGYSAGHGGYAGGYGGGRGGFGGYHGGYGGYYGGYRGGFGGYRGAYGYGSGYGYGGYGGGIYGYRPAYGYGYGHRYRPVFVGYPSYGFGYGYPGFSYGYYGGGWDAFGGFLLGAAVIGGVALATSQDRGSYSDGYDSGYDAHYVTRAPDPASYRDFGRIGSGGGAVATCAGMARDRAGGGQVVDANVSGISGGVTYVTGRIDGRGTGGPGRNFYCGATEQGQVTTFRFAG